MSKMSSHKSFGEFLGLLEPPKNSDHQATRPKVGQLPVKTTIRDKNVKNPCGFKVGTSSNCLDADLRSVNI